MIKKIWIIILKAFKFIVYIFAGYLFMIFSIIPVLIGFVLLTSSKLKWLQDIFMYIGYITCSVLFFAFFEYLRTGKNIFKSYK